MDAGSPSLLDPPAPPRERPPLTAAVLKLLLATAVLGTALFFGGRALYDAWLEHQVRDLPAEVSAHLDAGRLQKASEALGDALRSYPSVPSVLRLAAQKLPSLGADPLTTLHFWRRLHHTGKATTSDRAEMARTLLITNARDEARAMFAGFSPAERATPEVMELESELLRAGGQVAEADALLRRLLQSRGDHPESVFRLAALDARSPFREVQEGAIERLWAIARSQGSTSAQAIGILVGQERLMAWDARELLALIMKQGGARARPVRYQVLSAVIRLHPDQKASLIDKEVALHLGRPAEECLDLWMWLGAQGEHARIIEMIPQRGAVTVPSLFAAYAEALVALQGWGTIRRLLPFGSGMALSSDYLALLQARCRIGLGAPGEQVRSEIEKVCRRSISKADWQALQRAVAFAESAGHTDLAGEMLQEAVRVPQLRLQALDVLLTMHTRERATGGLLATVRAMQAAQPDESSHLERLLYLKLLMGVEVESVIHDLPALVTEERITPEAGRFLEAFVAMRLSDAALLRERLALIEWRKLPVGQRATYAGMLRASGQIAEAFAVAEKITRSLLLPEEEKLLLRAL